MGNLDIAFSVIGAVPGVVALIGAAIGYGKLQQRLTTVERDVAKLGNLSDQVSRIDERTRNTQSAVEEIKQAVTQLTTILIERNLDRQKP